MANAHMADDHETRTARVLAETWGLFGLFALVGATGWALDNLAVLAAGAVLQGLWMQRLYVVGHEAAHGKLYPGQARRNARWGQLALLPLLVPLPVFRKIHRFHHGANRRDPHTSALEVFVFRRDGPLQRLNAWTVWLLAVLAGGWFWHSVVSILLFLALPTRMAEKVSPAFHGWSPTDRARSIAVFLAALALHVGIGWIGGASLWLALIGLPLVVFAGVYSAQLYVYHYDTTIGPAVTLHARRLHGPGISWWLLNLNEHDTHHRLPNVVWYALPDVGRPLPAPHDTNQNTHSFLTGLLQQLRGPRVVVEDR